MTKKLLDIEKLKEDLEKENIRYEGIMCFNFNSFEDKGCFILGDKKVNSYLIEISE